MNVSTCGRLDRTENFFDVAFNSVVERGWGPKLRVTEWGGKPLQGTQWLREEETDAEIFSGKKREGAGGSVILGKTGWLGGKSGNNWIQT